MMHHNICELNDYLLSHLQCQQKISESVEASHRYFFIVHYIKQMFNNEIYKVIMSINIIDMYVIKV